MHFVHKIYFLFKLLSKQQKSFAEKLTQASHQINDLFRQKAYLEERLITREALENIEKAKLKQVEKVSIGFCF